MIFFSLIFVRYLYVWENPNVGTCSLNVSGWHTLDTIGLLNDVLAWHTLDTFRQTWTELDRKQESLHLYQEQSWFSNKAIHVIEQGSIGIHNVVLLNSPIATMGMTKEVITRLHLHNAVS